ncbi:hypothetical protein [Candidatus Palauibacter sp.]|uniref:hypothetical protein n=1 Tax=Candidatus Palauibacter sp. TaxID=3101350 RepID=UPI003C6FBF9B
MRLFLAFAAAGLVAGCSDLIGGGGPNIPDEVIGAIATDFHEDTVRVWVPDTVRVGEQFPVAVETYYRCGLSPGRTEIRTLDMRVEITPYMQYRRRSACPSILKGETRTVSIRFDHTGRGTVVFYGTADVRFPAWRGHTPEPVDTLEVMRHVVVLDR